MDRDGLVNSRERLVDTMGCWPSFHDARVRSFWRDETSCTVSIHVFQITDETDPAGYFVLAKHHRVELLMRGVVSNSLPENYSSDVLGGLEITANAGLIQVQFESHTDQDGTVLCESIDVVKVRPCGPGGG